MGVAPDNTILVDSGPGGVGGAAQVRGFDPATGALLWEVDLPDEDAQTQIVQTRHPVFSPDLRTVYVTTGFGGDLGRSYVYAIDVTTAPAGVGGPRLVPPAHQQLRVGPTPVRSSTEVTFDLETAGRVRLSVFSAGGRMVHRLVDRTVHAGAHTVAWGGASAGGARLAPGVYFVELRSDLGRSVRKVVIPR